uniref:Gypsy retrotransposon integrase-like protein 1 n=1 Tax=Leptobrachium leishanense TaxID=445787 RepID=A0A8C5MLK4_9ANUR
MVDGSTLRTGPVTHETIPLKLLIGTKHKESFQWDIVPSPLFPIVLGLPWLRTHNPYIDWSSNTVSFPSCHCRVRCMNGSKSEKVAFSTYPSSTLPPKYSEFQDVFEKKGVDTLPPHREYDCPIDLLPGAPIPHGRIFNLSVPESQSLKDYIEDSLTKGFIRHSTSPAGAGIFFVGKKDGGLRPCVDYRALNAITVRNRYPLPLIPELLDRVKDACIFTKIDLCRAYNLVRMREGDEWKTAFRSRYGHFEYLVMPFGLCNAPAAFQHFLNDIFRDVLDTFLVVYLDDLLVYSRTIQEHEQHVRLVLSRLRQHKLYGKIEKSTFEKSSIEFLGYVLSPGHVEMDKAKIKVILDWPTPRDKKMVQQFMGFANFYRRFIRSFSHLTAPITSLTKKDVRFCWTEEAQQAFNKLKESFTQAPILKQPDINLPYSLETDASDIALGAILSQKSGVKNLMHPVAFYSRRLSPAEKNYSIGEKELLAIKSALEEWRHLLEGAKHPVVVYTDHRNLEYLRTAKRLRPRQARWALFFARFLLHITYRPGVRNGKADALSRRYDSDAFPSTTQPDSILLDEFFCASQGSLIENIKNYSLQPPTDVQGLISNDGLFYHDEQIYVPPEVRLQVLQHSHNIPAAGHGGIKKTIDAVHRYFWWPSVKKDIIAFVTSCSVCARNKQPRTRPAGLLQPLAPPLHPWKDISMDFIVDLPPSHRYTTILVVVDRCTKMAHFIPAVGLPTAAETATLFIKEIFRLHGTPRSIVRQRISVYFPFLVPNVS